jgi:hypothetical protein
MKKLACIELATQSKVWLILAHSHLVQKSYAHTPAARALVFTQ